MALGKGLNSLIPPKGTRININIGGPSVNDSGDDNSSGFTTKKINDDEEVVFEPRGKIILSESTIAGGAQEIELDKIKDNSKQPRKNFDENKLNELAESIREYGVIEPLVLSRENDGTYQVIAGERRLKASRLAGLEKIPAVIRDVDDQERLEIALVENLQRENLDPIETARAYKELLDEFGMSAEKIAKRVGKSRSKVANTLRLLGLPNEIQQALAAGAINEGHAVYLMGIDSPVKQLEIFRKITINNWTVAETGKQVKKAGGTKHSQVKINLGDEEKQQRLEGYFGTKVEIKRTRKGGRILIDFYSDEELNSLMGKLK
jgi:ParB family chromosome partitioning protein